MSVKDKSFGFPKAGVHERASRCVAIEPVGFPKTTRQKQFFLVPDLILKSDRAHL